MIGSRYCLERPRQLGLGNFFHDLFDDFSVTGTIQACYVDVQEKGDDFVITADTPGIRREDLNVTLENGILTISGERTHEEEQSDGGYYRQERSTGKFSRSFQIPGETDEKSISASLKDGVLTIILKRKEETKPRRLEIK